MKSCALPRYTPRSLRHDRRGVAALEFALIGPMMMLLLFGTVSICTLLNNYMMLAWGVGAASQTLAESRGVATPYTNTINILYGSVSGLTTSNLTVTMTVNGTSCSTDSACQTALSSAAGTAASITATYPCNLTIMGVNYAPGCTLKSQTTEIVQ
jgi:Flp pilus assembly protein TadG